MPTKGGEPSPSKNGTIDKDPAASHEEASPEKAQSRGRSGSLTSPSARPAEEEVFPTPSTLQKKDLLHQKLTQKEQDLRQAQDKLRAADRQIKGLNTQLSEVKRSRREVQAELDELKERQVANATSTVSGDGSVTSAPLSVRAQDNSGDVPASIDGPLRQGLGDEHEALAVKLLENGLKLDMATVAAAAAGLKDTSVLETQLKRAREDVARLQGEIHQLNDTVFSKSFKPPSAWADREVKYKAEKRDWEQRVASLKEQIKRLTAENQAYRDDNKAAEFEAQIKSLNAAVEEANAEKVAAQQSLHDLKLKVREMNARRLSPRDSRGPENSSVLNKIMTMEDKTQTGHQRIASVGSAVLTGQDRRGSGSLSLVGNAVSSSPTAARAESGRADLQDIIDEYDDQGIRMSRPYRKKRSKKEKSEAFKRVNADASASESTDYDSSVDVDILKHDLQSQLREDNKGCGSPLKSASNALRALNQDTPSPRGLQTARASRIVSPSAAATLENNAAISSHQAAEGGSVEGNGMGQPLRKKRTSALVSPEATRGRKASQAERDDVGGSGRPDAEGAGQSGPQTAEGTAENSTEEPEAGPGMRVLDLATDLEGSAPVAPGNLGGRSAGQQQAEAAETRDPDARHDTRMEGVAGSMVAADTVFGAALAVNEDGTAPKPEQGQRASPSQPSAAGLETPAVAATESGMPSADRSHKRIPSSPNARGTDSSSLHSQAPSNEEVLDQKHLAEQGAWADSGQTGSSRQLGAANVMLRELAVNGTAEAGTAFNADESQSQAGELGLNAASQRSDATAVQPASQSQAGEHGSIATPQRPDATAAETASQNQAEEPYPTGMAQGPDATATQPASQNQAGELATTATAQGLDATAAETPSPDQAGEPSSTATAQGPHSTVAQPALQIKADEPSATATAKRLDATAAQLQKQTEELHSAGTDPRPKAAAAQTASESPAGELGSVTKAERPNAAAAQAVSQSQAGELDGAGTIPMPIATAAQAEAEASAVEDNGPLSPISAFAVADTGHLALEDEVSELGQPKAAALEHARKATPADGSPQDADSQDSPTTEQMTTSLARLTNADRRRKDLLQEAAKLLTRGSSEADGPWTQEDFSALQAERTAVEEELLEHLADQDVKQLKWRAALMESRVEMHQAQITKMQKALEEADQEKARVEQDLEVALKALQSVGSADLSDQQKLESIRERIREEGRKTAESVRFTQEALQTSYREVHCLKQDRDKLQQQLGEIANKINSGMIPDPEDLELPELHSEAMMRKKQDKLKSSGSGTIKAKRSIRTYNSLVDGLSEEEIEIVNLRQENETVMNTLVRTKVELAETEGDYLKMRRALIRAVEKQAAVTDQLESIKDAFDQNDFAAAKALVQENLKQVKSFGGDIESLGERNLF